MALWYGGDYNPEQWPEPVWSKDVALMREAGVNLVSLGVFAWARLEPAEGRYDFGWLERVMDLLHAGGVGVALATPTASPPPWFSLAYPDALPVTADGVRLTHGSRDTYCASAPAYREAALRIAGELAHRFGDHPALRLWHVHNEYGTWCHCRHTAAAFRDWLQRRHGDLDTLNDAWTTSFWSQYYSDWGQIQPPRATQYLANPAQQLDFRRFTSDELLAAYREQRELLRSVTPGTPVTTNFVLGSWVPVEHWSWASEVDIVAIDHYPDAADGRAEEQTAFAADLARGWARGRPWLLMEQAPNVIYAGGRMLAKSPGRMTRHSLAHIARGSRGAMFFQWRQPVGGAERFHSAMLPHAGPDSRIFRESATLGGLLRGLDGDDLTGAPVGIGARTAIVWDDASWWALQGSGLPSPELRYLEPVQSVHAALWRAGVPVDFVAPDADLGTYALVLMPSLYLVSDAVAASLRSYVDSGGQLVAWYFSGVADEVGRVRLGGYPGALRELLGVRVEEFVPLAEREAAPLSTGEDGLWWSERMAATTAEVLATYRTGTLAGLPALTRNRYGRGSAWYVSTGLVGAALARLLDEVVRYAGVAPDAPAPDGVELVRRTAGRTEWTFVLNHGDAARDVAVSGVDVVSGARIDGSCSVPAGGYAILRQDRVDPEVGDATRRRDGT
jgi:beta-galactosidase